MVEVAQKHQDELKQIKKDIENAYIYFRGNYDRFNEFRRFVFQTTISSDDVAVLQELNKPQIEFNILEAYISRLRGEFSKQEPSISVRSPNGIESVDANTIKLVEALLENIIEEANKDGFEYDIYTDLLSGGFSVAEVYTDYASEKSFDMNIYIKRVFDPTLCGFDPLARKSHKSDGRFCFQLYPKSKESIEEEFGKDITQGIKFTKEVGNFNWSYRNGTQEVVLLAEYYKKKKKKVKLLKLVNDQIMTEKQYEEFIERWTMSGRIEQPPTVVMARNTEKTIICRYLVIDNKVLEYEETSFQEFPLIFFDGNSIEVRDGVNGNVTQLTRPYVYHAKGVQKLKNFAGQTLANELENMVMHKFKVAMDSIPDEFSAAYENVQKANVLVYNAFKNNDPNIPLPPPQEIQRVPAPPEVTQTFTLSDQITQAILGNFDMDMGKIPTNALSGIAIQETATLGNAASMPYVVGFMKGLNQVANVIVDIVPLYWKTARTIPVMNKDGTREYITVNHPDSPYKIDYDENALEVFVEAGVNFAIQKSRALQQIIALMQASPIFAQFMNSEGLPMLLDNIEIRGIDELKQASMQFMQQIKQQQQMQQQAQQQAMQNNPATQKIQLDAKKHMDNLALDEKKLQQDQIKLMADMKQSTDKLQGEMIKAEAERFSKQIELEISTRDHAHRHAKDIAAFKHQQSVSKREGKNA